MITIVEYGVGNLGSIRNMFKRLGVPIDVTGDAERVAAADALLLPGIGHFDTCARALREQGLVDALSTAALERRVPVLGVCVGMQLLARGSEEGELPGLGWLEADVVRIRPGGEWSHLRVPHMGWNQLQITRPDPLIAELGDRARFYFVHSYAMRCEHPDDVLATVQYGQDVTAVVNRDNVWGTQFHPEKSHRYGMKMLSNFARLVSSTSEAG